MAIFCVGVGGTPRQLTRESGALLWVVSSRVGATELSDGTDGGAPLSDGGSVLVSSRWASPPLSTLDEEESVRRRALIYRKDKP